MVDVINVIFIKEEQVDLDPITNDIMAEKTTRSISDQSDEFWRIIDIQSPQTPENQIIRNEERIARAKVTQRETGQ